MHGQQSVCKRIHQYLDTSPVAEALMDEIAMNHVAEKVDHEAWN